MSVVILDGSTIREFVNDEGAFSGSVEERVASLDTDHNGLRLYLGLFGRFDCDGSGAVDLEEFRVEMREVMLVVANGLGFRPIQMVVEEGSFLERAVERESSAKSCGMN
ncbi:hypothetical protein BHM03_00048419 [Ensete ventricosum]|nr:hypothetical protein BHM03_00048419 [Ensete ventricosum]